MNYETKITSITFFLTVILNNSIFNSFSFIRKYLNKVIGA